MEKNLKYDKTDKYSIYDYAKEMEGYTFNQLFELRISQENNLSEVAEAA